MVKRIKEVQLGSRCLVLETGEIARQANASVMAKMDGTEVLVTVCYKKDDQNNNDFFPLTVNYQERFYAAGRIPGGFLRREGRPGDNETLNARLIDRPIRPLFPKGFTYEVQVVATVMSMNPQVNPDVVAMAGASCALALSGLPFAGPIGAVRVGYADGMYQLNPSANALEDSQLNLVVAGTQDAVLMVESEADQLDETVMLGAVMYGHEHMQAIIQGINELVKESEGSIMPCGWVPAEPNASLLSSVRDQYGDAIAEAYTIKDKLHRYQALKDLRASCVSSMTTVAEAEITSVAQSANGLADDIESAFADLEKNIVRQQLIQGEVRIDGRDRKTVRPISIRTQVLPRTHGSVLFTRGETQAMVVVTLGNERDAKIHDYVSGEYKERCMLHYNFPPYCVGETGMMSGPKRREIGHGNLARRAIEAVLPVEKECPYTLRLVSEITESNGSSSMATVCGSSLALMDAGVAIKAPVAGVAMGLIKEGDDFVVLTDILADEDHLGDMDFKVAGTEKGITALQMDIKINGITETIMSQALAQAKEGRLHILSVMNESLDAPRETLSDFAPQVARMRVPVDKIRNVIGKGGATIKGITESTGVSVDIDDDGNVTLFSPNREALEKAQQMIKTTIAEVEVGKVYKGKVSKIVDFGAFINLLPGKDGLLHISQITQDRSQKVSEFLTEGEEITVFVEDVDKQGRVKLVWRKDVLTTNDGESSAVTATEQEELPGA